MSVFRVNTSPSTKDLRRFALAMLLGFGVIGALAWCSGWWRTGDRAMLTWVGRSSQVTAVVLWSLGVGLCAAGFGPRLIARTAYVGWMTVGVGLGVVASTILLTLLFALLLPVFSLIVRLGDPLRKKLGGVDTYWEEHKPYEATLERMQRPF